MILRPFFVAVAGTAGIALGSPVFAETPGNYWGVSYTGLEYRTQFTPAGATAPVTETINTNGAMFRLGREIGKFFAIEAHLGYAKESQSNAFGNKFEFTHGAAYGRLNLPYERFNLYVKGGVAEARIDVGTFNEDDSYDSAALGMDFFASERSALTLEYLRYQDEDEVETDIITVGIKYHFEYVGFR